MSEPSNSRNPSAQLGKILLLSSGETSKSGRMIFERTFAEMASPIWMAILETPAGFELNSSWVAQRVSDFVKVSLKNFSPEVSVVSARRRDGPFSTNDADILAPMMDANYLYMGAGSPTYLVKHLKDSLALSYLVGRHRMGATLCFTSAAAIALGAKTLPVYEIFKVGQDPYWAEGLNFLGLFGLDLAIVTHWNNNEGGDRVDTSRCFVGQPRLEALRKQLPPSTLVLGIDERTGVLFDFQAEQFEIVGAGSATILGPDSEEVLRPEGIFPMSKLGPYQRPPEALGYGPPVGAMEVTEEPEVEPSQEVLHLIQKREQARQARDWSEADAIRDLVATMGFEIQDSNKGVALRFVGKRQ